MARAALAIVAVLCFGGALSVPLASQDSFTGAYMPYAAFDRLPSTPLEVAGGTLKVGFAPGDLALPRERLLTWIEKSARAVSDYYGRFPVKSARVLIVPATGQGVRGGQAFGYRGAAIRLHVGRNSTEADLTRDWQAVHEMIHLASPSLGETHLWLAEGLSVYVESIARVQAGHLSAEKIWGDFVRAMPQGLPQPGDRGLDQTPTWGRTYWGGAMFCLLADIEIRKRTGNKAGLQTGLRAIVAAGGSNERAWPVARLLRVIDEATGAGVLSELYERMRATPYAPDLDALWRDLGVSLRGGAVTFDEAASMAPIRRAITAAPAERDVVAN